MTPFYRARYYNPAIGRFVSEDPVGFKQGINLFSYVHNKPLMFKDPSGLVKWHCVYGTDGAGEVLGFVKLWFSCTSECINKKRVTAHGEAMLYGITGGLPVTIGVYDIELYDDLGTPDADNLTGPAAYAGGGANFQQAGFGCVQLKLGAAASSGSVTEGCGLRGNRAGISGGIFAYFGKSEAEGKETCCSGD